MKNTQNYNLSVGIASKRSLGFVHSLSIIPHYFMSYWVLPCWHKNEITSGDLS
jgi:hypothetical protein